MNETVIYIYIPLSVRDFAKSMAWNCVESTRPVCSSEKRQTHVAHDAPTTNVQIHTFSGKRFASLSLIPYSSRIRAMQVCGVEPSLPNTSSSLIAFRFLRAGFFCLIKSSNRRIAALQAASRTSFMSLNTLKIGRTELPSALPNSFAVSAPIPFRETRSSAACTIFSFVNLGFRRHRHPPQSAIFTLLRKP